MIGPTGSLLKSVSPEQPVLIAGPTASGKSALALSIAEAQGGVIVNADALQVFENWRILTARPGPEDEARARHVLYGHVPGDFAYSVGHWLRDARSFIGGSERPIIVGGTGLYFSALTEGLTDIPPVPDEIHEEALARIADGGLEGMIGDLDPETRGRIDLNNPRRVQRAWEVLRATGRGIASWQDETPPPILPASQAFPVVMDAERDWLRDRIARRFDLMLEQGLMEEARRNLADWDPRAPSAKAIGASELVACLSGKLSMAEAREAVVLATRQYAKRQRTWFRARMGGWTALHLP